MKGNKKIGLFGGLFDPPHIAHLILAQSILGEFGLSEILFIPAFNPPHKKKYSPYKIRCHMLNLAIQGNPRFRFCDIESRIKGKTYTVDVIRALKEETQCRLFLIIGSDQWAEIETWKTPQKISNHCQLIIIPRLGFAVRKKKSVINNILVSHAPIINISSTIIRALIKRRQSIHYLVPPSVEKYIKSRKLYLVRHPDF